MPGTDACPDCLCEKGSADEEDDAGKPGPLCFAWDGDDGLRLECKERQVARLARLIEDQQAHAARGGVLQTEAHKRIAAALERVAGVLERVEKGEPVV